MPTDTSLEVIFEDEHLVVVDKPSGLLAVPGRGPEKRDCVTARVRARYSDCIEQPAVHRLDMDTSGLMVVALRADAHRHLSRQFQGRRTSKRYLALLAGRLARERGTLRLPFRLDVDNRPYQILDEVRGKLGITHWRRIGIEGDWTRVAFTPVTGRTHQLRVHAAHERGLGIPIVGDLLYGNGAREGRLRLHACDLAFTHPGTGAPVAFHSPAPF
jgi:tRNA pseudouridine32 synthase/23S rRNA pseudouridine746 synthase